MSSYRKKEYRSLPQKIIGSGLDDNQVRGFTEKEHAMYADLCEYEEDEDLSEAGDCEPDLSFYDLIG